MPSWVLQTTQPQAGGEAAPTFGVCGGVSLGCDWFGGKGVEESPTSVLPDTLAPL